MLLRALPDLAAASPKFRQWFQAKWGEENCIILHRTAHAEFRPCTHTLSIRAVWGGEERCQIGDRIVAVDDDNFLILNDGRVYSTSIRATSPVESLAICFRPSLVRQTQAAMAATLTTALDDGEALCGTAPEFVESLQPHDLVVSPVLRFIRSHVLQGVDDEAWYEEQLHFLLERMQSHHLRLHERMDALALRRRVTRREVFRRIALAVDYLHTNYAQSMTLDELARVAYLSKYHFLRLFVLVHGMTPISYLQRKRAAVALRLLRTTRLTMTEIACAVGFVRRTTVLAQIRRWTGLGPQQVRGDDGTSLRLIESEQLARTVMTSRFEQPRRCAPHSALLRNSSWASS